MASNARIPGYLVFLIVLIVVSVSSSGQETRPMPWAHTPGNGKTSGSANGLFCLAEIGTAIGLGDVSTPYSKSFTGGTFNLGFQIHRRFYAGAGSGISFYNPEGTLFPVFLNARFFAGNGPVRFYLSGEAGLLVNGNKNPAPGEYVPSKYIAPGGGLSIPVTSRLSILAGMNVYAQYGGDNGRDSFITFKLGILRH